MTNKEVFMILFDISIKQLKEMSQEKMMEWEKGINKLLWGGFNVGNRPAEEGE